MLFLWFYHAAQRSAPRFMMVADHINFLTFEDPAAVNLVRRALKLAAAGDLYGAAETAGVDLGHAAVVSEGLRRGMRYSIGAEIDNDPRSRPDAQNIVDAMKPDGLIRSVHFLTIDHPVHGPGWQWPFDNPEFSSLYETLGVERVWEIYMATLLESIEKLPGHIVGHFYVPAKFGHWPADEALERYEDQLVAACRERGMAIELNTRFLYRYFDDDDDRRRYVDASLRLLRKAKAQDVGIAVGSDAHSPKDQSQAFERVLEMLDEAEINELVFPIGGRLARVALRAPKEPVVEQPPEPEPAAEHAEPEPKVAAAPRKRAARPPKAPADAPPPGDVPAAPVAPARPARVRTKAQPKPAIATAPPVETAGAGTATAAPAAALTEVALAAPEPKPPVARTPSPPKPAPKAASARPPRTEPARTAPRAERPKPKAKAPPSNAKRTAQTASKTPARGKAAPAKRTASAASTRGNGVAASTRGNAARAKAAEPKAGARKVKPAPAKKAAKPAKAASRPVKTAPKAPAKGKARPATPAPKRAAAKAVARKVSAKKPAAKKSSAKSRR